MAKLIALFRFFLCLSLLFYVPPSVQVPDNIQLQMLTLQKVQERVAAARGETKNAFSHKAPQAKNMDPPRNLLGAPDEAEGHGSYFVRIGVGTPPQQFYTKLNTHNDLTWIQCNPCAECSTQTDPVFDPLKSNSYRPVPCDSGNCQQIGASSRCNSATQTCLYEVHYLDKSGTNGEFVTETISFPNNNVAIADVLIGCARSTKVAFYGQYFSGMLSLGRGSPFLFQAKYTAFAYCIAHKNSPKQSLVQFRSSGTFEDYQFTTAMLQSPERPDSYYVNLTGISVNNQVVAIPPLDPTTGKGGANVGLGTDVTRFPPEVYNRVRDVFLQEATGFTVVHQFNTFDACALTSETHEADFPTVEFHFGPHRVTLPPENVMFYVGNYICFGFAPRDESFSTIGNYQQQGIRVSFDLNNLMLGFLPGNC